MSDQRAQWGSRIGFILAAAGSAIGLGNIWRFPYMTGENGGGWFVLIYLVCVALVGLPIMMAEIMIGRSAQKQPVGAFRQLQGGRTAWAGVGWLGVLAGFIILSYYIVVAGWAMDYTLKSIVNFSGTMHDRAELEATKYRVAVDPAQMRRELTEQRAVRESKPAIARIKNSIVPSAWNAYEQYVAALKNAQTVNVTRHEAWNTAWADQPDDVVTGLNEPDLRAPISAEDLARFELVQAKLFEKPVFAGKVGQVLGLLEQIELTRKQYWLESKTHFGAIPDGQIRSLAENMTRRKIMREQVENAFGAVAGDGWMSTFWMALFMIVTIAIVVGGIAGGIERACGILMPTLFILMLVLVVYGMFQRGFGEAITFVFKPDATKLHPSSVLQAMGQAFFSLSLGMGAMITYGSYQQRKSHLVSESITIAGLDTAVALLACLMIFPIVFTFGQEPSSGPGLVFMSMPLAFAEIGKGGMLLAVVFFGLLVFAALTSSISLLEVVASYFIDEWGWSRMKAVSILGGVIFLFGIPSAFSGDVQFAMGGWSASYGTDFLSTMDYLASNWMLPLGGFLIAAYVGWVMPSNFRKAELDGVAPLFVMGWLLLVRFVAPALVIIILLQSIGVLDADELFHGLLN